MANVAAPYGFKSWGGQSSTPSNFEQSEPANFDAYSSWWSEASALAQLARLLGRIAARQALCSTANGLLRDRDAGQTLSGGAAP
jgi:hypothetical protein